MFEQLIAIDRSWLLTINGAHAPWADALMWQVSQAVTWLPLYVVLIVCLFVKFRGQRTPFGRLSIQLPTIIIALVAFVVAVGCADLLCAQLIKPLVARPRPTHDIAIGTLVHVVNGYRGGAYGFCSNHAANTMACALLSSLIFTHGRRLQTHLFVTLPLMAWVLLNCYSRMYLGVHYPLDIAAGLAVGTITALVVWHFGRAYLFPNDARAHPAEEGLTANARTGQE